MITEDEVRKIAKLAKLKFTAGEVSDLAAKLTSIMAVIDDLNAVACDDVKPLTSVCEMTLRMRKDEVVVRDIASELFTNVPGNTKELARERKCFVVPKVI